MNKKISLSVVIPAFNEADNLNILHERLTKIIAKYDYEIIIINDGSSDGTAQKVKEIIVKDSQVKLIDFSRNFGQEAATAAGLEYAKGEVVVVMDADLQDPPEVIDQMLAKWQEGYEVVYAVRESRRGDRLLKKILSYGFYWFIAKVSDIKIPRNTGDFRLLDRKAVEAFKKLKEKSRLFRGLISFIGFKQTAVYIHRDSRNAGETKYSTLKSAKLAMDGIISFSTKPLSLITFCGILVSLVSIIWGIVLIFIKTFHNFPVPGWTSLMVLILFVSGFQIFLLGILAEYIARILIEVKDRPLYLIKELIDEQKNDVI